MRPGPQGPGAPPPGRGMPPGPPSRPGPGPPPPGRGMPPAGPPQGRPGPPGSAPPQGRPGPPGSAPPPGRPGPPGGVPPPARPGPPGGMPSGRAQPQMAVQRPGPQQAPVGAGRARGQGIVQGVESLTLSSTSQSQGSTGTPVASVQGGSNPSQGSGGQASAGSQSTGNPAGLGRGGARGRREAGFIMTTRPEGLVSKKGDGK